MTTCNIMAVTYQFVVVLAGVAIGLERTVTAGEKFSNFCTTNQPL